MIGCSSSGIKKRGLSRCFSRKQNERGGIGFHIPPVRSHYLGWSLSDLQETANGTRDSNQPAAEQNQAAWLRGDGRKGSVQGRGCTMHFCIQQIERVGACGEPPANFSFPRGLCRDLALLYSVVEQRAWVRPGAFAGLLTRGCSDVNLVSQSVITKVSCWRIRLAILRFQRLRLVVPVPMQYGYISFVELRKAAPGLFEPPEHP